MTFCHSLYVFSIELLWNGTKILICDKCLAHHVDTYNYESTNTNQTIRSLHIKLNDKKVFILIRTIAPIGSLIWLYSNYESIVVGSIVGTCYVV
jgi:hypothetical protein